MANALTSEPELLCGTVVSAERAGDADRAQSLGQRWVRGGGRRGWVQGNTQESCPVDPVSPWEMKVGACQQRWGLEVAGEG